MTDAAKKLDTSTDAPQFTAVRPMPLYEIAEEVVKLLSELEVNEGELTDEQFEALEALEMAFDKKAENICRYVRELDGRAQVFADEAKRLAQRGQSISNLGKRLKKYLHDSMCARGVTKIQGKLVGCRVQKSAPSVEIETEAAVPREYFITPEPAISKTKIKNALKAGEEVPGAVLVQHTHLRIF